MFCALLLNLKIINTFLKNNDNHQHHPSAAEQATTRLLHALRSLASVAIWPACILPSSYTVKNNRNFTDPVMGNCDKKSTGNREFTGKCPYILYINGQCTVLLQIIRKSTGG